MNTDNKKPIVLVFTSFYKPKMGGAELAIQEIAKRLKNNFDFHIITHRLAGNAASSENDDGILIHRIGFGSRLERMFIFPFLAMFKGFSLANKFNDRKILSWGLMISYASIGAFFLKFLKPKIPFILTIQEGDLEWSPRLRNLGQAALWWKLIFKKSDHVTALSKYLLNKVRESGYKGPATVLPNGVDENLLSLGKFGNEVPVIFSASRLVHKNGLDILLRAAAKIKDELPFRILLAGAGRDLAKLQKLKNDLGLGDKVEFLGNVSYEKLKDYYKGTDLFVRPSRSEGLGSAFLESMAAGVITIGANVGGIPDFLFHGKTGFLVEPDNVEALSGQLKESLTMSLAAKDNIIKNARTLIKEKFLWNDVAGRAEEIFNMHL